MFEVLALAGGLQCRVTSPGPVCLAVKFSGFEATVVPARAVRALAGASAAPPASAVLTTRAAAQAAARERWRGFGGCDETACGTTVLLPDVGARRAEGRRPGPVT